MVSKNGTTRSFEPSSGTTSGFEPTVSQELIVASKTGTTSSFEPT
jgi:hypothetical protein